MPIEINLLAIGKRIEALRGRLSQSDFAEMIGVDRKTIGTWERGEQLPATKALISLWSEFDADPAWVLTGKGFAPTGTEDERELLALFRVAPLPVKAAAIAGLAAGGAQGANQVFHGDVGQAVKGDVAYHQPVTFNVGKGKKK